MYLVKDLCHYSYSPYEAKVNLMEEAEGCLATQIAPRLLSLAQLLVSIIALPIILLVGLTETAFRLCTCSSDKLDTLKCTLYALESHLCMSIPVSFMGIFLPYSATEKIGQALDKCQKPLLNCLRPSQEYIQS